MRNPWAPGGNGIGRHQPGAERPCGIEILAHRPLRRAQLKIANRRIVEQGVARNVIEGSVAVDAASSPADHHGELRLIVERERFAWLPDRFTVSDQTRREPCENFGIDRLFESAFLEMIIVVETDTEDFRRLGHRWQYPNCVQVDCVHGQKVSARAQQICALRNQFGKSAWKSAFALRKAMPARAVIRRNSAAPPFSKWTMRMGFSFSGARTPVSARWIRCRNVAICCLGKDISHLYSRHPYLEPLL